MHRAIVGALAANAVLFSSSIAVITWATGDLPLRGATPMAFETPSAPASVVSAREEAPAVYAAAAPSVAPTSDSLGVVAVPPPASPEVAAFASPERRPPRIHKAAAEMPARRRHALRDFRLELKAGVTALQQRVSACALSGASFNLALESVKGGVRIVNATVDSAGASDESGVACAEAALRGQLIPAASIEPGKRWQMPFAVDSSI